MANLKVPNLCGANAEFNAVQSKFESLRSDAVAGLESEASSLASTLDLSVTSLTTDLRDLIPEVPSLPDVNLQSLITSLSSFTPGTSEYITLLNKIKTDFGTELTASGYSLDTLVTNAITQIGGGGDLCSVVPNFVKSADGLTDAKEKSSESKQPDKPASEEKPSTVVKNKNLTADKTANEARVASMQVETSTDEDVVEGTITSTTPPTESTGAYKVTDESSEVTYDGNAIEVTTPAEQDRKNISTTGLAKRKSKLTEYFKLTAVGGRSAPNAVDSVTGKTWKELGIEPGQGNFTVDLKHIPIPDSVKVSANWVEVEGGWFEKDDGTFAAIEGTVQEFRRVPKYIRNKQPGTPKTLRERGTDSIFTVGTGVSEPQNQVNIIPQGEIWKPHTKTNNHPVYFIPELEGVIFKVTYSYFENYDPGLVETG